MYTQAQTSDAPQPRRPLYRQLYVQVLVAICIGVTLGYLWPHFAQSLKPLGDGFIKLVKMIIAPVIFLTVATGIAGMSDMKAVGSVAGKAFAYFLSFSTLALIIGLIVANVVRSGRRGSTSIPPRSMPPRLPTYARQAPSQTISGFLLDIIPTPCSAR